TLTLSGNNTFSGGTVLNSGSLNLGSPGALSTVGTVIFNGGVLQYSPSNQTDYSGRFSTASNQVYKIDTNSEDVTFSAPLNSAGTLLEKIGEGKLIFSDLSRFTAGGFTTTISGGDLVLPTNDPSLLTANSLFSGAGTLRIEPISPSFGSNITLSSLSFGSGIFGGVTGSTFGSLVLGKSGNAVDLLLDGLPSNVSVNSDQTYYGSEVTVPSGANVGVRTFAGGTLSLIAQTDIHIYDTINVTGAGGVILKTSQDTAVGGTGTYDLGAYYDANTGSAGHLGKINFDGTVGQFFKTQDGSTAANLKDYTLASSLDVLKDGSRSGYFALSADINAASFHGTDANSNPVYYSSVVDGTFTGIFAGLGHEISNLQLTNAHAYTGMFAQISSATIQDIALSSFSVSAPNHYTGSLVGRAHGTVELAGIILKNSSISSPNHNYIGGLIGYSDYGTILNSWIINTQVAGHYMTGGIAGRSLFSTVTNVHNVNSSVTATGNHHTGGLFGDMYNQTSTVISNSSSSGNITSNQQQVGGLVGRFSGSLVNSYSTGDVYGSDYVGGLVGVQYNTQTHTGIYSTGDVTASVQRSGGLFGQLQRGGTILNSYASGTIKQISHAFAGGLVGINEGGQAVIFDNSYFDGDVIGNGYLGGIIGSSNGPTTIRNGSYVSASLIQGSGAFIGGLVGISNNTVVIKDAYVTTANINASDNGNTVGGLVGQAAQVQAENTYVGNSSAGGTTITSRHLTGGLVGKMSGGYIRNAYFKGTIDNTSHNMSQYGGIVGHLTPGSYLSNVFYNIDATQINGAATATMAGIYNDQYNDWFNSYTVNGDHRDIASKALDIDAYLTKSGDYYLIQTVQDGVSQSDLSDMLGFTLSTLTGSANAYKFRLTADLDMSVATTPFIPYFSGAELIGTNSGGSDFHVNNFSWAQSTSNVGFLGFVQKSLIEDITVNTVAYSGQSVGQTNSIVGADYVGAVMGSMYQGKIHNVHAVLGGAITADNYVGGVVGFLESAPMGVVSATRLSGVGYDASLISASNDYVGGIGGRFINTAMKEIDVDLNVSGRQFVGGVAGYAQGNAGYTDAFIEQGSSIDIHSTATSITASSGMVGGLFGEAHSGTNGRDWSTTASVTGGSDYVGGLVGFLRTGSLTNVHSTGANVIQTGSSHVGGLFGYFQGTAVANATTLADVTGSGYYTGGMAGIFQASTATNVHASGNVTAVNHYAGGLIGYSHSGAISNASAVGRVDATSKNYVGGLIGYATSTTVSDATASGDVAGTSYIGGFIGRTDREVLNSSASGNVSTDGKYVGGLVGYQEGYGAVDSNATGSVSGTSWVGGLTGLLNGSTSYIKGSFATGSVTGSQDFVGGLVGALDGSIEKLPSDIPLNRGSQFSYAAGAVDGIYDVGGLVGRANSSSSVEDAYSTGNVAANLNYGGLIGYFTPGTTVLNSHYNIDSVELNAFTSKASTLRSDVSGTITIGGLYGSQYATWKNLDSNGDPLLDGLSTKVGSQVGDYFALAGDGAYELRSVQDLIQFFGFADRADLNFKLTNDIDLSQNAGLHIPYVAAGLNFNGKSISGLDLNQMTSGLGFVGHFYSAVDASASNLSVSGDVTGVSNLGLAAGGSWQRGLANVSTSGEVHGLDVLYSEVSQDDKAENRNGYSKVGGVLGYGWGSSGTVLKLQNVQSSANVSGVNAVGGLSGRLEHAGINGSATTGTVTSNATAQVATPGYTGGLVGYHDKSNSYIKASSHSTGLVQGYAYVGGLAGFFEGALGESVVNGQVTYSTFVDSDVRGKGRSLGGLVGEHEYGSMTNAQVLGRVSGWYVSDAYDFNSGTYTGGLVGYSRAAMSYVQNAGPLVRGGHRTGGLAGQLDNSLSYSTASALVESNSSYVGGLLGEGDAVSYSSFTGNLRAASSHVGGLVGVLGGTMDQSFVTGDVTGLENVDGTFRYSGTYTGGLVGYTGNTIQNSYFTGSLVKGGHQTGGIVGYQGGWVNSSYSTGDVEANSSYVGGVGGNVGYMNYSYATGNVTGTDYVGGLAGQVSWLTETYATGDVKGTGSYIGGLAGNLAGGNILRVYATGDVIGGTSSSRIGGLAGQASGTIIDSYSTGAVTASNAYRVGGFIGESYGTVTNSFASGDVTARDSVGGFIGYGNSTVTSSFSEGNVISTGHRVGGFIGSQVGGTIDQASSTGNVNSSGNYIGGFAGEIRGVVKNSTSLVGTVSDVSNFGVSGNDRVGGFVGSNSGTITDSTSTASVKGSGNYVGGFVGIQETSSISGAASFGSVTGDYQLGGFVGNMQNGVITKSYSNSEVIGTSDLSSSEAGGFVGRSFQGTISLSRASGNVSGPSNVGGFVGYMDYTGTISKSYATGSVTQDALATMRSTSGVGGFAGYLDFNTSGGLDDIYAMGSVHGNENIGGLVGYAKTGEITDAFSTGVVLAANGANSGGSFGQVRNTTDGSGNNYVTITDVYFDSDSSGKLSDGAGTNISLAATGVQTASLKGSTTGALFDYLNTWGKSDGLYPYITEFYPNTPQALFGVAKNSDGSVAVGAQVLNYSGSVLINGGAASTGADGSYYSLIGSGALFFDGNLPSEVISLSLVDGGSSYVSAPTVSIVETQTTKSIGSATISPITNRLTSVSFSSARGSGATISAFYGTDNLDPLTYQKITGFTISNSGSLYGPQVDVTIAGGTSGTYATATALTASLASTSKIASTLVLAGDTSVSALNYSENHTIDSNRNVERELVQGLTELNTSAGSYSAMNSDIDNTIGSSVYSTFSQELTQKSRLDLTTQGQAGTFDIDVDLNYDDGGVTNAGTILVKGSALSVSSSSITSSDAQSYLSSINLLNDLTLTGTMISTDQSITGNDFDLTLVANWTSGSTVSGVKDLSISGSADLGNSVSTTGTQSYASSVLLQTAAIDVNTLGASATGSDISILGAISIGGSPHDLSIRAGLGDVTLSDTIGGGVGIDNLSIEAENISVQTVLVSSLAAFDVGVSGSVGAISDAGGLGA
ncbi:hypothetical protein N9K66_07965, partial [Planktomarina temperata]|nr:hypothetical protein [Planktomarina temperata]